MDMERTRRGGGTVRDTLCIGREETATHRDKQEYTAETWTNKGTLQTQGETRVHCRNRDKQEYRQSNTIIGKDTKSIYSLSMQIDLNNVNRPEHDFYNVNRPEHDFSRQLSNGSSSIFAGTPFSSF